MKTSYRLSIILAIIISGIAIGYVTTNHAPQQTYKAIIFDMDGTTLDTDHVWKSACGPILDSHAPHLNQTEKDEIITQFQALTIYEVWNLVHSHCSVDISTEQLIEENIRHLHVMYEKNGISFIPHFKNFHAKVVERGLKTAIATSSTKETIDVILTVVPLADHFSEHIYHVDCVNRAYKPKPDVYLHAAEKLNVQPCDCIAIEDSATGIKAAKAAGMYCIGINTSKNRDNLKQADEIIECYSQINLDTLLSK